MKQFLFILIILSQSIETIQAHPGIGIVMDSEGNVFYTDLVHVWKISADGHRTIAVSDVHTHELYIDAEDNLFGEHEWYEGEATDKWGNFVWCLKNDGKLITEIPAVEGFLDNNTLVRDHKGNSFWADRTDEKTLLRIESSTGQSRIFSAHEFDDIRWMYYSVFDKNLYVVDNIKIKKVSPSGNVSVITDHLKEDKAPFEGVADRHYIFGLWMDQDTNLYVAVYGAQKIVKINPSGQISTFYESPEGWSPCGGITAPDGTQWIMEFSSSNQTRVRAILPDGEITGFE